MGAAEAGTASRADTNKAGMILETKDILSPWKNKIVGLEQPKSIDTTILVAI